MADSIEKVIFAMRRDAVDAADPLNYFADRLAALPRAEWRDISTAPKDGSWVLVHGYSHLPSYMVQFKDGEWRDQTGQRYRPKPLPPPPAKEST